MHTALPDIQLMQYCRPVYEVLPGWEKALTGACSPNGLAPEVRGFIEYVETNTDANVVIASVGADREETVLWGEKV